ncbi:MAG: hypothetical protein ACK4UN_08670 [Limisphaerales bacterium]
MLMLRLSCAILFIALLAVSSAQGQRSSNWRVFKAGDGLAESFVTSVSFSQRTNVWVKHFEADKITLLDGYRTKSMAAPDRGAFRIHESRSGQIWASHAEGLQEFKGGTWVQYPVREIRQEYQTNATRMARGLPLVPLRQGHVLVLLSDQLLQFNNEWPPQSETILLKHVNQTRLGRFTDLALGRDGTLWLLGQGGMMRLPNGLRVTPESNWQELLLEFSLGIQDLQHAIADDAGGITATADAGGRKMIVHHDGCSWTIIAPEHQHIRQAWKNTDGTFWAVGINSLLRQDANGNFVEEQDVPAIQFFDVALEGNNVFWLATSDGLLRYSPPLWQPVTQAPPGAYVRALWEQPNGDLWIAQPDGLYWLLQQEWKRFPFPQTPEQTLQPGRFIFPLPRDRFVTTFGEISYCFDLKEGTFKEIKHSSGASLKALGLLRDGTLCMQVAPSPDSWRLESFDGDKFLPLPFLPPTVPPDVQPLFLFSTSSGEVWISTDRGLAHLVENSWQFTPWGEQLMEPLLLMAESGAGKVLAASRTAVTEFDGKSWNTLRHGFDRVNSLTRSKDGTLWVASSGGVHRFFKGVWLDYGTHDGLPAAAAVEVLEDRQERIWVGTSKGLVLYRPEIDSDPPWNFITKLNTSEEGSVSISFSGADKFYGFHPKRRSKNPPY